MSQNQRRHDLSVWSSGPLFGGFDTDPRCDLQTVLAVAFGREFVEFSRIRSKFPSKHFSLQRWRSVTPVVVTSNFWCRQSLSLKIPVLIWWLTRRFCVEFKVGCLLGTPARLVVHGQKRFCSRAVADDDDQSVREVAQVPSVVALCPRKSVGGDVATSSVETSPDRWRPMIRCQAMESRQISVRGSRLGRVG